MSEAPPPTIGSALLDGTVTLEIGPDRLKFHVHKALLVRYSEYFSNALNGRWKEAEEGVIKLTDVQPVAVKIFTCWLYCQALPGGLKSWEWRAITELESERNIVSMIQAYVFADRFLIPAFRRAINKNIIEHCETGKSIELGDIRTVAEEMDKYVPSDRPIVQYFVDLYCTMWTSGSEDSAENLANLPHAFTIRAMRRLRETFMAWCGHPKLKQCYLEHVDKKEATACRKPHMKYDKETDFGVFRRKDICRMCKEGAEDTGSSSSSDAE